MNPKLNDLTELQHFGVKGMKWGVRKERPSSEDIQKARVREEYARTKVQLALLEGDVKKAGAIAEKWSTDPDRVTALRTTRGEKAALLIIGGPFGAAVLAGAGIERKLAERDQAKRKAGK